MSADLDRGFREVIQHAESQFGVLIPPDFEAFCRRLYYTGAIEAAALIECDGCTPKDICTAYRAAFPDTARADKGRLSNA